MAIHTIITCDRCGIEIPKSELRLEIRKPRNWDTYQETIIYDLCQECECSFKKWVEDKVKEVDL